MRDRPTGAGPFEVVDADPARAGEHALGGQDQPGGIDAAPPAAQQSGEAGGKGLRPKARRRPTPASTLSRT